MRIEFLHSDREDFQWSGEQLRIGSADDNDLVLPADTAAERHAVIRCVAGIGMVLEVLAGADRVYVNARPVRERALLRGGDILGLGRSRLLLCADPAPDTAVAADLEASDHAVIGIRAMAGPCSGRIWSLQQPLRFGAGGIELPMPSGEAVALDFERDGAGLRLRATGESARFPVRVNGVAVALPHRLAPGDQVGLGMHRLLVEAPGLLADRVELPTPPPVVAPAPPPAPRGEVGWLILTAAILALGIALVFWIHH